MKTGIGRTTNVQNIVLTFEVADTNSYGSSHAIYIINVNCEIANIT